MSAKDKIIEGLLIRIDREQKLASLLDKEVNQAFIDALTDKYIDLLKKDLEGYDNEPE
jgi:hypothetical protein